MNSLAEFLAQVEAEEAAATRPRDLASIVARAKQKGLIKGPGETVALKVAVRRRLGLNAIDKSDGVKATELATMQSRWMDVTPVMAELWLLNNVKNRSVSQDTVNAYAREMSNGRWLPTHQGLAFDDQDALNDGQHRLLAIVQSGCTVRLMVTFGLPSKVQGSRMTGMDTIDRGKTRSVADQLKIQHGMKGGSVLAMICNRLAGICSPERTRRLSVGEVLEIHQAFEREVDWVIKNKPTFHGIKQAGVLAGFAFALASARGDEKGQDTADGPRIERMFDQLCGRETPAPGSPMMLLHVFLTSEAAVLLTRGNDRALAELVLQAVWLELMERRVEQLQLGTDGIDYFRLIQAERVECIAKMFRVPGMKNVKKPITA